MKLGVMINCAGYEQNIDNLEEEFLISIHPELESIGFDDIELVLPHSDWLDIEINPESDMPSQDQNEVKKKLKKSNKGLIVRKGLNKFKKSNRNVMLHVDGSKKFDLKSLIDIAIPLLEPSVDVVSTNRNISGIPPFRELLEDFEKFILERIFGKKVYDGQSGCWGLNLKTFDKIINNLCSESYEIELEILIEALINKLKIVWLPINVTQTGISKFEYEDSIKKMKFICEKLNLNKTKLKNYVEEYEKNNKERIDKANKDEEEENRGISFGRYKKDLIDLDI